MNSVGDILRSAREQQGRTLDDISAATHIDKKFLMLIESGGKVTLPETYVRAFTRSYALEVGVDPSTISMGEPPKAPVAVVRDPVAQPMAGGTAPIAPPPQAPPKPNNVKGNPTLILFGIVILAVVAMGAILFWSRHDRTQQPVQEVSFTEAVHDKEMKGTVAPPVSPNDTMAFSHPVAGRDSLTLDATTSSTDSVWVRVESDSMPAREVTLPPGGQARWRARYHFTLSVSNANAIVFRLNGKELALLSSIPKPMSNISFSWNNLDTLQHGAAKMPSPTAARGQGAQNVGQHSTGTPTQTVTKGITPRGGRRPGGALHRKKSHSRSEYQEDNQTEM